MQKKDDTERNHVQFMFMLELSTLVTFFAGWLLAGGGASLPLGSAVSILEMLASLAFLTSASADSAKW